MTRAIAWFAVLAFGASALAEVPKNAPPQKDGLQVVLDLIHDHAANDAWMKEGWKDDRIEGYLEQLVASIAKATDIPDLKLPVRFSNVKPVDPNERREILNGVLIVGKDLKLAGFIRNSIVLTDGSVEFQNSPENCVIVARSAVSVRSISQKCLIVAGAYIGASTDGQPFNPEAGSMIVTRGFAGINTAYGSIIAAPGGMYVPSSRSAIFLNAPVPARDGGGSRTVQMPDLPQPRPEALQLSSKFDVLGVVHRQPPPPSRQGPEARGIVFRFGGRRHMADLGDPIVDDAGNPVEELRDWQLAFVTDLVAIFRTRDGDVVLPIEKK